VDPVPVPDLAGRVVLLADAGSATARALHAMLLAEGALVLALYDLRRREHETAQRRTPATISTVTDLGEPTRTAEDVAWLITRAQRLDLGILVDAGAPAVRSLLTGLAVHQLGLTRRFDPHASARLLDLAPNATRGTRRIDRTLRGIPFTDEVRVTMIDAWPDAPLSAVAAVRDVLAAGATGVRIERFDPLAIA
jgi:NAD(P)-dependent dehydrogenase (short-subunit alcohol dehydrogenase family)